MTSPSRGYLSGPRAGLRPGRSSASRRKYSQSSRWCQIGKLVQRVRSISKRVAHTRSAVPVLGHVARLDPVDHLVKIVAEVFANLIAHFAGPLSDTLRIVFVEIAERGGIG